MYDGLRILWTNVLGKLVPSGSSQSRGVPGTSGEGGVSVDACFGVAPGEWGTLTERNVCCE